MKMWQLYRYTNKVSCADCVTWSTI